MRTSVLTILTAMVLGGCVLEGGDEAGSGGLGGKADGWGSEGATIAFGEDWSETLSGTVRGGGALHVRYDADRLPECRGEMGGMPQWGISASASVDGAAPEVISLTAGDDGMLEGSFEALAAGSDLALWFTVSNRWGCVGYDSDFGSDYHFPMAEAPAPGTVSLHFDAEFEAQLSGPIHVGDELSVSYALGRLPDCRGTMYGRPAWSITGWYSVDGAAARSFEVSRVEGDERIAQDAVITVPGGDEIAFWFEVTNRWGCHGYDSNYGDDWTFPISP